MGTKRDHETNMVSPPFPSSPPECDETHPCEGLGRHATFRNFGMAFLTLFRVSTGDNWNGIMKVRTWRMGTPCQGCWNNRGDAQLLM